MVKRSFNTDENEPEASNFKIPSEREHLFVVTDVHPAVTPSGNDDNIQVVHLEIVGGDEEGLTLLNRCNLNQDEKAFYFTRLFLKAICEPYKGAFEIETDRWIGRQFYATVKHTKSKDGTKTYANIAEYNFDKKIEQVYKPVGQDITDPKDIVWEE
jgi:hypothetical protein